MKKETYIREKAQYLVEQVVIDADNLDLHLIEKVLDEVFQVGVEEGNNRCSAGSQKS